MQNEYGWFISSKERKKKCDLLKWKKKKKNFNEFDLQQSANRGAEVNNQSVTNSLRYIWICVFTAPNPIWHQVYVYEWHTTWTLVSLLHCPHLYMDKRKNKIKVVRLDWKSVSSLRTCDETPSTTLLLVSCASKTNFSFFSFHHHALYLTAINW